MAPLGIIAHPCSPPNSARRMDSMRSYVADTLRRGLLTQQCAGQRVDRRLTQRGRWADTHSNAGGVGVEGDYSMVEIIEITQCSRASPMGGCQKYLYQVSCDLTVHRSGGKIRKPNLTQIGDRQGRLHH